ncbi:uncharacterized protein CMC5_057200 [Chondromyces crocatus]|uniref:Uncharacterized protein n=1 Tax=Chondromyces crocatus TaxID=52 RepID=A0A0K1ELF9_CHOCO|nr:uncharacterized protein CMC5_057200 [Chondromyces crocatus]
MLTSLICCGMDSDVTESSGTVSSSCHAGECDVELPFGWEGPVLLWSGEETLAPSCPDAAPTLVYEGHAGLQTHGTCGTCACSDLECLLPTGVTITKGTCGGPLLDVLAPPGWDGSCWPFPPIKDPEGAVFWGTSRTECQPLVPQPEKSATSTWATFARACSRSSDRDECRDGTDDCSPSPAPGFVRCVFSTSEANACPPNYPEMHRFHGMAEDRSSCSPCRCSPPETSTCRVFFGLSVDSECTIRMLGTMVGYQQRGCILNSVPSQFASMTAEVRQLDPGICTPQGGEFLGGFEPTQTTTFCCEHGG